MQRTANSAWYSSIGRIWPFANIQPAGAVSPNGRTTFALPNLDGRTVIGVSSLYPEGDAVGADNFLLTAAELPAETAVPEPATWAMMALGFAAMGFFALRRVAVAPAAA